ncbi:MAG: acetate--CoA ligase family protein [Planctomycetes bacterium]|nr:acetate--CoA ligase family protein [Planctomycetota bacterium]
MEIAEPRRALDPLFHPRSVAVVGASRDPSKLGHVLLKNVLDYGFVGNVYPVNPQGGEILKRSVYTDLRSLPQAPDLVLLSIPNRAVPGAIRDAAARGAKAAVILASGFGEMGGDGAALQEEVRASGLRILGPNCMGVYNLPGHLNATYFWELPRREGNLAFVSQSGAYGGLLFGELRRRAIGVSVFASIGNQADITHADVMEWLEDDPRTRVVGLFVEEIKNGPRFFETCRRLASRRAVVALKVGRTGAGKRAAQSHTGSMAGDGEVVRAALRQAGVVVARDTDEFFDALAAYSAYPRGISVSKGLAIVTISGGPCVAAADAADEAGVPVPELRPETQAAVRALVPEFGALTNPDDMTPQCDPERFPGCVEAIAADPQVGALLAINVGLDRERFGAAFAQAKSRIPVLGFVADVPMIQTAFAEAGIPMFPTPERAVRAFALLNRGAKKVAEKPAVPAAGRALDPYESSELLEKAGIPRCRQAAVASLAEARIAARRFRFPVVLKALHAGPHKSRRGGVVLNVTEKSLPAAWRAISGAFGPAAVVQEMLPAGGHELLLGARRDPVFGPVVMFGGGGVWTELSRDVAIRIGRIARSEARSMIAETNAGRRLALRLPKAISAVAAALVSLAKWMERHPQVLEVDANPVIASEMGLTAVDALVIASTDHKTEPLIHRRAGAPVARPHPGTGPTP